MQVGLSLLPPEADAEATRPRVAAALTGDPRDYTSRYRVIEDRGVGPRMVLTDPAVATEYAVRIEAQVDVGRVRSKLGGAGLALRAAPVPVATATTEILRFPVVLEGLTSYTTYTAVRRALVQRAGVRSARPLEFARGRAVLEVESTQAPAALAQALPGALAPELLVEPLPSEGDVVRIRVTAVPAAVPAAPEAPAPATSTAD